ncbi:hypothetical protein Bca4012_013811 [Brassica carinata]
MATKLFSPSLSCPWLTSRDVAIRALLPRRRLNCVTRRNRVSSVTAMVTEPLTAVSSSAVLVHQWWEQNPGSLLLMAETGGGYSLASYYTSLGLFVISVPGLWSLIKRSVKSKIVRKTFVVSEGEGVKKEPKQVAGEILSFFTRKNFNITDRGETITFEGTMVPSRGQAALLTGAYYWKKASRKEEIKVKMMVGENGKLSEVVVQGDDVQVEEMRKDLQLSEKGMVYVKGLFESS